MAFHAFGVHATPAAVIVGKGGGMVASAALGSTDAIDRLFAVVDDVAASAPDSMPTTMRSASE